MTSSENEHYWDFLAYRFIFGGLTHQQRTGIVPINIVARRLDGLLFFLQHLGEQFAGPQRPEVAKVARRLVLHSAEKGHPPITDRCIVVSSIQRRVESGIQDPPLHRSHKVARTQK